MATGFWVFEFMYCVNNDLTDCEVCVVATRDSLVDEMQKFFATPRAVVLLAEVVGAWFLRSPASAELPAFYDATPFLKIAIAGETLPFGRETAMRLVGDLGGGELQRRYLSAGRSVAEDATEADADDTGDPTFEPFEILFDAKGFADELEAIDGAPLVSDEPLVLRRPIGAPGFAEESGPEFYVDEEVSLAGPGWYVANPGIAARRFEPNTRFQADLGVPMV